MLEVADIRTCDLREGALILVDKPIGWTSFDVVNKVRWAIRKLLGVKRFKVGHSGTLDPMASGLLLLCVGKWTKKLHELQGLDKIYTGTMTLGGITASYDAETAVTDMKSTAHITEEQISVSMSRFTGKIMQKPPMFSAIKVDGKPLYRLARKGQRVELEARPVEIFLFEPTKFMLPKVDFEVACTKGTYIRSLVHDVGQDLGCGAYLSALRRRAIGSYRIEDAWNLEELVDAINLRGDKQQTGVNTL